MNPLFHEREEKDTKVSGDVERSRHSMRFLDREQRDAQKSILSHIS